MPLNQWLSTPESGGLTLKYGKDLRDVPHLDLAACDEDTFETIDDDEPGLPPGLCRQPQRQTQPKKLNYQP